MMRRMMNLRGLALALAAAASLSLSACAGGIVAATAGPYAVGEAYSVQLGRTWADISSIMANRPRNVRVLTVDGILLNRLYLASDVAPGTGFMRPANREDRVPLYRADMTSRELADFMTESVTALGFVNVQAEALQPATFAGRPGVQFRFTAQSTEGLNYTGRAAAAARDGALQAMFYLAASEHYYDLHAAEVDSIFASVVSGPAAPAAAAAAAPVEPEPAPEPVS